MACSPANAQDAGRQNRARQDVRPVEKQAASTGAVRFGALAVSLPDRLFRYSGEFGSQAEAEAEALRLCREAGGAECVNANWFSNACGALAFGQDGWGASWGVSPAEAERNAVRFCHGETTGCRVVESVCAGISG
jgi:serine/threonine-protein kinase